MPEPLAYYSGSVFTSFELEISKMEIREKLAPYCGKRVVIRGWADRADVWTDHKTYRNIPTRIIQRPEVEGQIICGHVWLFQAGKLKELGVKPGDFIEFEAEVCAYKKKLPVPNKDGLMQVEDYNLQYPSAVKILEKAESIYDAKEEEDEKEQIQVSNPNTSLLPEGYARGHKTKVFKEAVEAAGGIDAETKDIIAEVVKRGYEDTPNNRVYAATVRNRLRQEQEDEEQEGQPTSLPNSAPPVTATATPLSLAEAIKIGKRAINVFGSDPDKALTALSELETVATLAGGFDKLKELVEALK
jgi:hypothetical protein